MILKILSISTLIFFINADSCGQVSKADKSLNLKQKNSNVLLSPKKESKTTIRGNDTLRSKLKGIWTDGETEKAVFEIKENTIFYVDNMATYKYTLIGNKMSIIYPDYLFNCIISFRKDTLIMNSKDYGVTSFWKFKN